MIASLLLLNRVDVQALKITDAYSLHRVVYDLFEDVRTEQEKQASMPSGILYADKDGDFNERRILLLSDRAPRTPVRGRIESKTVPEAFLQQDNFRFEVLINPSKRDKQSSKTVAVRGREPIRDWFLAKAPQRWGFDVNPQTLQVQALSVLSFDKGGHALTLGRALIQGELKVLNHQTFVRAFQQGIGRGRAFGLGLLQLAPTTPFNF